MKVAFCFSGVLRDVNKTSDYWLKQIAKYNADVYGSFWDIENPNNGDTISEFIKIYNPKKINVSDFSVWKKTTLDFITPHINPPNFFNKDLRNRCLSGNIFSMWYQIWLCNTMAISNNKYDIIIRLRSDIFLNVDLELEVDDYLHLLSGSVWANDIPNSSGPIDFFAYGNEQQMNYYSVLYFKLFSYLKEGHYFIPAENPLKVHLTENKTTIKKMPLAVFLVKNQGNSEERHVFNKPTDESHIHQLNEDIVLLPEFSFYQKL